MCVHIDYLLDSTFNNIFIFGFNIDTNTYKHISNQIDWLGINAWIIDIASIIFSEFIKRSHWYSIQNNNFYLDLRHSIPLNCRLLQLLLLNLVCEKDSHSNNNNNNNNSINSSKSSKVISTDITACINRRRLKMWRWRIMRHINECVQDDSPAFTVNISLCPFLCLCKSNVFFYIHATVDKPMDFCVTQ